MKIRTLRTQHRSRRAFVPAISDAVTFVVLETLGAWTSGKRTRSMITVEYGIYVTAPLVRASGPKNADSEHWLKHHSPAYTALTRSVAL